MDWNTAKNQTYFRRVYCKNEYGTYVIAHFGPSDTPKFIAAYRSNDDKTIDVLANTTSLSKAQQVCENHHRSWRDMK